MEEGCFSETFEGLNRNFSGSVFDVGGKWAWDDAFQAITEELSLSMCRTASINLALSTSEPI